VSCLLFLGALSAHSGLLRDVIYLGLRVHQKIFPITSLLKPLISVVERSGEGDRTRTCKTLSVGGFQDLKVALNLTLPPPISQYKWALQPSE